MSGQEIQILDLRSGPPGKLVAATLHEGLGLGELLEAELAWRSERLAAVQELLRRGRRPEDLPQHWHWNWQEKAPQLRLLANEAFGIKFEGRWQGLVMTTTVGHNAKLNPDAGKPLVYVKYIESAPWNLDVMTVRPQFGAIGTRLLEAAVRQSLEEGFSGRVGLHALPNAKTEGFYQRRGFVRLGTDAEVEGLPYYELTPAAAARFLDGDTQ